MPNEAIRILVADDQYLVREGITSLLIIDDELEVVAQAGDGKEAIQQALEHKPDVVLMDIRMPVMNGVEATAKIRENLPDCHVIMLTTFDDDEYIVQSLLAGACGYLMKDIPPADLARAVKLAHAGVYEFAPSVASKLIGSLLDKQVKAQQKETLERELTPRELDVLRLLAQGASNKKIAKALGVSEGTVKNHVSNILMRLELKDRTQAAVYAVEHGLT
ncbi:MAG: response regulator transcription factor [Deinococcota bacterium]